MFVTPSPWTIYGLRTDSLWLTATFKPHFGKCRELALRLFLVLTGRLTCQTSCISESGSFNMVWRSSFLLLCQGGQHGPKETSTWAWARRCHRKPFGKAPRLPEKNFDFRHLVGKAFRGDLPLTSFEEKHEDPRRRYLKDFEEEAEEARVLRRRYWAEKLILELRVAALHRRTHRSRLWTLEDES